MGVMVVYGPCFGCGQPFTFSATRVPSIRDPRTGHREPICRACVDHVNPQRVANGLDPIVPLPGAYDGDDDL